MPAQGEVPGLPAAVVDTPLPDHLDQLFRVGRSISGYDAVRGNAAVVADLAGRWAAEGWPCQVDDSGTRLTAEFSAPSAGSPPWAVYRLTPTAATALRTTDPGGATRFRF